MNKEAYNYSIRLLSQRDYSRFKLRQKLKLRDYSEEEIIETINLLEEQRYLREDEYIRMFIRKWIRKGQADQAIVKKAQAEKLRVSETAIQDERKELHIQENQVIQDLIQKKSKTLPSTQDPMLKEKYRNRVIRYLLSKGFSYPAIRPYLTNLLD